MRKDITIRIDDHHVVQGILSVPENPIGVVLFAHGSGSSRLSPRNTYVAEILRARHIATLLVDLLTEEEDTYEDLRFDIALLTERLGVVAEWLLSQQEVQHLPLGLFGASTGAASALMLAAKGSVPIAAVVSRGGRVDLAEDAFANVHSPTLFIVGEHDDVVKELNKEAYAKLRCEKSLKIIPNATHLFEERGALEEVAHHAADWFTCVFTHLS